MATDNVEFYERMQTLQAIQEQREHQRMSLERELNSYLKSDKRLSRVRVSQLQSYWAKICEDERRSRARNEQLLREYDRVEAHVAALSARTERLRLLKDQYEKQIEMMYPKWREEVEIKRRQQLLQQQKEQQQMAQQIQLLQQQQQQPHMQQPPNYLSPNQQPQQQLYGSSQMLNMDDVKYNHLKRTSPVIPSISSIQVQANTPPQVTPQDPRYTSVQFSTQPPSPSDKAPNTHYEHAAHYQSKMNAGSGSYEIPISGNTFSVLNKQPQTRDGSQMEPSQQTELQEPTSNMDTGDAKPRSEISVPTSKNALLMSYPNNSSVYSEVRTNRTADLGLQNKTTPGSHSQVVVKPKTQPPAVNSKDQQINSKGDGSPSHQDPHSRQQKTHFQNRPAERQTAPGHDEISQDDDSIVTPLNDEDDTYVKPSALKSKVKSTRRETADSLSSKAVSSARTDPFTSEDDDDEENSIEERALRHALQKQLNIGDETVHGRNKMPDKGQARSGSKDKQKQMTEEKGANITEKPPQISGPTQSNKALAEDSGSESESDIASDMSLPLSDDERLVEPHRSDNSNQKHVTKTSAQTSKARDTRSQPKVAVETVSEHGFWQLVTAVEQEIEDSDNIEKVYNLPECTTAIKNEIVKTVNNDGSLEYLNPNAISMVVLDQLQQMAHSMPGGCLLSDKLLDTKRAVTEVTIRSFLYSSALAFWDKLMQHLVLLVRKGVMDVEEVASMVAPRLISPDSACWEKAVDILTTILQGFEKQEDGGLEDTYSTLPSASATPSHHPDVSPPEATQDQRQAPPPVPPLDLGATPNHESPELETDRVSHDSFFDEPQVPLKETKAYQQMMQSSQGHTKPASQDITVPDVDSEGLSSSSDEEDDEIEKATRLSPEMPSSARTKKRKNILSSLGGNGSLGISYGDGDNGNAGNDDNGSGSGGRNTKRSEGMSDVISSASASPSPKGSGYVHSAKNLEQSLKSTGRSDPTQRSAAFWGEESDMEESEMTVPMGTGTLKSDDYQDDFDFYD